MHVTTVSTDGIIECGACGIILNGRLPLSLFWGQSSGSQGMWDIANTFHNRVCATLHVFQHGSAAVTWPGCLACGTGMIGIKYKNAMCSAINTMVPPVGVGTSQYQHGSGSKHGMQCIIGKQLINDVALVHWNPA